jgi:hypothetical protein
MSPKESPRKTSQILNKVFAALPAEGLRKSDIAATLTSTPEILDTLVAHRAPGLREGLEPTKGGGEGRERKHPRMRSRVGRAIDTALLV